MSPETKRLKEIAIATGASILTTYEAVRKRLRIEARRQEELDDGVEPEVVLDSFVNPVELEQHPQSRPLMRVLTPAAKAAKHRRARDKKLRETLCWWGLRMARRVPTAIGAILNTWCRMRKI